MTSLQSDAQGLSQRSRSPRPEEADSDTDSIELDQFLPRSRSKNAPISPPKKATQPPRSFLNPMKYVMGVYALTGGVYATAYEIVSAVFGKTAMGDLFYVAKDIKDLKGRADKRKSLKDLSASKLYVEAIVGKKSGGILHLNFYRFREIMPTGLQRGRHRSQRYHR